MPKKSSPPIWETGFMPDAEEPQHVFDLTASDRDTRLGQITGICRRIGTIAKYEGGGGHFSENLGVTRSWVLARDSYIEGMMEGTIHFASTAVECALNLDERTESSRARFRLGWLSLSNKGLRLAGKLGLPVEALLDEGESLNSDAPPIRFVRARNNVAHGDYRDYYIPYGADLGEGGMALTYYADIAVAEALNQFRKCSDFLYAWVAQKPKMREFAIRAK